MFSCMGNHGFHIKFENGVTVSVQFGYGHYCNPVKDFERRDIGLIGTEKDERVHESHTAEIAIWDKDGGWLTKELYHGNDDVKGWLTPEEVLVALNWAKEYRQK